MKLTDKAIETINIRETKLKLALVLGFTEFWVSKLIKANNENSPLTLAIALQLIQEETGLTREEILEEESITESTKE